MMIAVGLELDPADLLAGLRRRGHVAAMLVVNLLVFPAVTWLAATAAGLTPGFAAGLLLCAAAPGGPTGPLFTKISKGDLGFATASMALLGFVGLLSAPATMTLVLGEGGDGIAGPMFRTLALFQILPLVAAMVARRAAPTLAARVAGPVGIVANLLLLGVIIGLLYARGELLFSADVGVQAMLIGLLALPLAPAALAPDPTGRVRAAGLVTAVRNLTVALLLSGRFFPDPETDVAILVWAFWMMLLPAAVSWLRGRKG